ncbi:MAG: hypothetical protein LBP92_10860 [Deltaproteobacteria bacterium]|jgi:hypothetical protein|nr:hypothetical protein [Deltaproteobacteria bacterium]
MLKKLFSKANFEEKSDLYGLLDFLLASLGLVIELLALLVLAGGMADRLSRLLPASVSERFFDLLLLAPVALAMLLVASLVPALRSHLRSACGLDRRSLWVKLALVLPYWIFGFVYLWLVSWILLMVMRNGQLVLWTFMLAFSLWALVFLGAISGYLTAKARLRPMADEEVPAGLFGFFDKWQGQEGRRRDGQLMVLQNFGPGLSMPSYLGRNLIVTEKALAAFPPEALKAGIVMAMVSQMLKLNRNCVVLRLVALSMAIPASMMLLYSLGLLLGYPMMVRPNHVALVWMGCWLSFRVSNLVMNLINRILFHRLNLATATILGQVMPLVKAIETMSRYNLVSWKSSWWRRLYSSWPGPREQIRALMAGMSGAQDGQPGKPLAKASQPEGQAGEG